jgi:hypothetical protein
MTSSERQRPGGGGPDAVENLHPFLLRARRAASR